MLLRLEGTASNKVDKSSYSIRASRLRDMQHKIHTYDMVTADPGAC